MLTEKPPYVVPTMAEIEALPWNGYRVASLFAGAGGSSTGYRMAGFRVVYANEVIPAAADSYALNARTDTVIDRTDVRQVTPEALLAAMGLTRGELDILDGSPPCDSFSTAGPREAKWGKTKSTSGYQQRTDDLFYEYARILDGVQPRVFVAENVSGLVKGTAKGYFKAILRRLRECGYRVEARLLDGQWMGLPQHRERIIFLGVRADLSAEPSFPSPLTYRYSVREVLNADIVDRSDGFVARYQPGDRPLATVVVDSTQFSMRRLSGEDSMIDPETGETIALGRFDIATEWARIKQGEASTKYFSLKRTDHDAPALTISAMGGQIGAASVTHGIEPRKFNLIELRVLCGFPPDYQFVGNYRQRWERMGLAVPPVMMRSIAETIRDQILKPLDT